MKKLIIVLLFLLFYQTAFCHGQYLQWSLENWTIKDQYDYVLDPEWKAYDVMHIEDAEWNLC